MKYDFDPVRLYESFRRLQNRHGKVRIEHLDGVMDEIGIELSEEEHEIMVKELYATQAERSAGKDHGYVTFAEFQAYMKRKSGVIEDPKPQVKFAPSAVDVLFEMRK